MTYRYRIQAHLFNPVTGETMVSDERVVRADAPDTALHDAAFDILSFNATHPGNVAILYDRLVLAEHLGAVEAS